MSEQTDHQDNLCRGCGVSVRIPAREVDRLVNEYVAQHPTEIATDDLYQQRLKKCESCPALSYGTTCSHCGCLVAIRAKLADKECPAPLPRW